MTTEKEYGLNLLSALEQGSAEFDMWVQTWVKDVFVSEWVVKVISTMAYRLYQDNILTDSNILEMFNIATETIRDIEDERTVHEISNPRVVDLTERKD